MNFAAPFIARPVATTLFTLGLALAGSVAFFLLPVSPLPQVDFPTISVQASLPGASPETMATSVATPLERHLGQIADVSEMTSQSTVGNARVTLQFGLNRNIDGAARDVQAGINAARADLPAALKSNPTYRKVNPADAPIMILTLTSKTQSTGTLYDAASTVLAQKISQVQGIGQVTVGGGSLPAVRVELNPTQLYKYGIGLEDVRAALSAANANSPKGALEELGTHHQIYTNDQAFHAADYKDLIVAWRHGAAVHLSNVAEVNDAVEDLRNLGLYNGDPSVVLIISKQPGANIVDTIDRVKNILPELEASIPASIDLKVSMDRSTNIRNSLHDVERSLMLATVLVILVVFVFLRNGRATLIPCVAVPVSLIGTFGAMFLLNESLDNLSLMALTISTGFVVDDAIVVLENIVRHMEEGMPRGKAALLGAREVGFTVLSMSLSLIAVFIPILLMAGIVGRLFREFAITLTVAVLISLVISLTTTPMMCARLLIISPRQNRKGKSFKARFYRFFERILISTQRLYDRALMWSLHHEFWVLMVLFVVIGLNVYLYILIPKGLFPQQDTGAIMGSIQADQGISFQAMKDKMTTFVNIVKSDPGVQSVNAFTGGNQTNSGFVFVSLKPLSERHDSADQVIARLRGPLNKVAGASLYLQAGQDVRVGGRGGNAQYQYTLQADDLDLLRLWAPKLTQTLQHTEGIADVNSDQQDNGLETELTFDRTSAARLNLNTAQIDNTLYDAFGQRQVSVIYNPLNQYHVIMEVAPQYWQNPDSLKDVYISTSGGSLTGSQSTAAVISAASRDITTNSISATGRNGSSTGSAISTNVETMIPLATLASIHTGTTPLGVNHQGHFAATTLTFNLPPGKSLSDATSLVGGVMNSIGMPSSIHGNFQGTAQVFQQSFSSLPFLIFTAFLAVYIVLGILYESFIHPLTIISTLPSAGIGALLALRVCGMEFNIMGFIGVILLIGIVKKNAIMMIDFALDVERRLGISSRAAIYRACLLRFRPILMTTMAAILGALPLAIGFGEGSELRRPLGVAVVGGLIVSQLLTLFTTPVVYLYLDRLSYRSKSPKKPMEQVLA